MSAINPDHLHHFRFIGRVLGKALCDEQVCVRCVASCRQAPGLYLWVWGRMRAFFLMA
jgi:hypothetical protein